MKPFLIVLLLVGMSTSASAFTLKITKEEHLVKWQNHSITLDLDSSLDALGPNKQVAEAIQKAFSTWVDEAGIPINFEFVSTNCTVGYSESKKNENCICAKKRSSLTEDDIGGTTMLTYAEKEGNIIDADVVFFTDAGKWTLNNEVGKLDVYAVTLHEAGHLFGMEHSKVKGAVMYAMTSLDEASYQELHDDDIRGAEALYDNHKSADTDCDATLLTRRNPTGILSFLF